MKMFAKAIRRVELFLKSIITIGGKKSFWCDSRPWLCFCCGTLRNRIRGAPPSEGITTVIDKNNTIWVFKHKKFNPPYWVSLGKRGNMKNVIVNMDGTIQRLT